MAVFKCKMCGAGLDVTAGARICQCSYCKTMQTVPLLDSEERARLYDRADHYRRSGEYDRAASLYEQIVKEMPEDAESYWSLVLCRYGVEYVEDPATKQRIPTCNRTQFTSILEDADYQSALRFAAEEQVTIYQQESATIDRIQKNILAISEKEAPFDIFICYKESGADGRRTPDSVLAQELYYELTQEGYRVFFSRITLERMLGTEYEPYIFAALHSAQIMIVVGTKPEHLNAPWVKNEWGRYLALMRQNAGKTLIPAYRDMDPYELPLEFSRLQALDMSRLGFMQDLLHGIRKILGNEGAMTAPATAATPPEVPMTAAQYPTEDPILTRAFICLEDGDFEKASDLLEGVLNRDPTNGKAYMGKVMVAFQCKKEEDLGKQTTPLSHCHDYNRALRYTDGKTRARLLSYQEAIQDNVYGPQYDIAVANMKAGDWLRAYRQFNQLEHYRDAAELAKQCEPHVQAIEKKKEAEDLTARAITAAFYAGIAAVLGYVVLFVF